MSKKSKVSIVGVSRTGTDIYIHRRNHQHKHYYNVTWSSYNRMCKAAWKNSYNADKGNIYTEYWIK